MGVMGAKNSHVHSGWKQNKRKVEVRKVVSRGFKKVFIWEEKRSLKAQAQ